MLTIITTTKNHRHQIIAIIITIMETTAVTVLATTEALIMVMREMEVQLLSLRVIIMRVSEITITDIAIIMDLVTITGVMAAFL